jgi:hypothetical protein
MQRFKRSIVAACLVTGFTAVGACNKGPDPSNNAAKALKNANLDASRSIGTRMRAWRT